MNIARAKISHSDRITRIGRKLVQIGFLGLFLFPLGVIVFKRVSAHPAPTFTSWLLPWDPLLLVGQLLHGDWTPLVEAPGTLGEGAPLMLLALSF